MKYQFSVQKRDEDSRETDLLGSRMRLGDNWEQVFSAEINPDEMVELMQHLWDIANRRKTKANN
jgi:hypothetical protein